MIVDRPASTTRSRHGLIPGGRKLFLLFRIGSDRYVLDTACILQVLPLQPLKQLPGTPAWVAGVLSHGGMPIPVIDLSARAQGLPAARVTSTRLVLVEYRPQDDAPLRTLGLVLEGATETIHRAPADFVACGIDNPQARYLGPVLDEAAGMLQWVTLDALLPEDVRAMLFSAETLASADASPGMSAEAAP